MDIVLTIEDHAYVLTTPCPEEPTTAATATARREFKKWRKSNGIAHCYMVSSIAGILQHQFQSNDSPSAIMTSLKEMFGEYGRPVRHIAMQKIMNANMLEGSPVREHVLKTIRSLNELETLGAKIDAQTQVDMISTRYLNHSLNLNLTVI